MASANFLAAMAALTGTHPVLRIIWKLDAGDQDISQYFLGVSSVTQEKERAPDKITAGDANLTFNNKAGVFTENSTGSFLNAVKYHNRKLTVEVGFDLDDGTTEYVKVATMKVRSLTASSDKGTVNLQIYDLIARILTEKINKRTSAMTPVAGGSNTGNGTMTAIDTKPFKTVAENWTITCTLGGADATATFGVVGSVSGNIGTATSGTEFFHASFTGGVKFTIRGGATNWIIGDAFTFSTVQMMEWTTTNPLKIIWSILTGYNYDTNLIEAWSARTPLLDRTQSTANTDLDWTGFQAAVANIDFTVTGFIPWGYDLSEAIEEILLVFLGACNVDGNGLLFFKVFKPSFAAGTPTNVADTKKLTGLTMTRDMREMINDVTVKYRRQAVWPWSDEDEILGLDGVYVVANATSKTDYSQAFSREFKVRWHNANATHVSYFADRLVDKYGQPPTRFTGSTGLDALEFDPGDVITITDEKLAFTNYNVEVIKKEGDYDAEPKKIVLTLDDAGTTGLDWAYIGSLANEGDGLSPQAATFDTASVSDKQFCYVSQTGGSGGAGPDYYCF